MITSRDDKANDYPRLWEHVSLRINTATGGKAEDNGFILLYYFSQGGSGNCSATASFGTFAMLKFVVFPSFTFSCFLSQASTFLEKMAVDVLVAVEVVMEL